jgi:hypothetical protein
MDDLILVAKQVRKKPRPKPGRQGCAGGGATARSFEPVM